MWQGLLANQVIDGCGCQRDRKMGMNYGSVEVHWYLSKM